MSPFESFEKSIEPKSSEVQKESDGEVLEKPPKVEISVDPANSVEGLNTYSILRRISESSWGRDNNVIDRKIKDLDGEEREVTGEKFNALMQKSNEEALEWVAFANGKPESIQEKVITQLTQHKGFDEGAAKKFFGETTSLINRFNDRHPELVAVFKKDIKSDIERKGKNMAEIEKYVDGAVQFFNPKKETTKMERIHLLPNDSLTPNEQEEQRIKELVSYRLRTNPGYKDNPPFY